MAHATTTFDRHYEGKALLVEVPTGVTTKALDYHFDGVAVIAEAAGAAAAHCKHYILGGGVGLGA